MSGNPINSAFRDISTDVWNSIKKTKEQGRKPKEEAITEERVFHRLGDIPKEYLITVPFNKRQEGLNGADWEWVFLGKNGSSFSIRVQAKVINPHKNVYHELHYKNAKKEYQSDLLIKRAKANNALPLYCLYNYFEDVEKDDLWTCSSASSTFDHYGCALIDASKVKALRIDKRKSLDDLKHYFLPMHCAVSCKMDNSLPLPDRIRQYWNVAMGNEVSPAELQNEKENGEYNVHKDMTINKFASSNYLLLTTNNNPNNDSLIDPAAKASSTIPAVSPDTPEHVRHILNGNLDLVDAKELYLKAVTIFFESD